MEKKPQKFHMLLKDGKIRFPEQIVFFDAETNEYISKGESEEEWTEKTLTLRLGWAMHWDKPTDRQTWKPFTEAAEFWDWIEALPYQDISMFAHNSMFDMTVTKGFTEMLHLRGWKAESIYMEGRIFMLEMWKDARKITVYDSMNYLPTSLEEIGKAIGTPKRPKPDFKTVKDGPLSEYCKNDVLVLYKFIRTLFRFLEIHNLTRFRPTAASLAAGAFRHKFHDPKKRPVWIHARKNAVMLERDSYLGGICDCFKIGKIGTPKNPVPLHLLDINSMYPHAMKTHRVPNKLEWSSDTPTIDDMNTAIAGGRDVIADLTITLQPEHAYIAAKFKNDGENKTGFIAGTFRCAITTPEIKFVQKHGKINEIHRLNVYLTEDLFGEYVDFFYGQRMKYEKEKNAAFAMLCKLFLNSLYGKWGQKDSEYLKLTEDAAPDFRSYDFRKSDEKGYEEYRVLHFGTKIWKVIKTEDNAMDSFVAIASHITAHARMHLISLIQTAGRENTYYCDTDSLIVNDQGLKNLKNACYVDREGKKTLGKLKYEGESLQSEFIRPKFYTFNGVKKCKGVRRNFETLKPDPKRPGTIRISQEQFTRVKTNMRDGNIDGQRIVKVIKNLRINYDKGQVKEGNVTAFDASQIEPYIKSEGLAERMQAAQDRAKLRRMRHETPKIKETLLHDAYAHMDRTLRKGEQLINPRLNELREINE